MDGRELSTSEFHVSLAQVGSAAKPDELGVIRIKALTVKNIKRSGAAVASRMFATWDKAGLAG